MTDPVEWILKNFWIPEDNFETGEPGPRLIDLQPYVQDCLREALSRDENGYFKYSLIIWSDIKKSAKSSIAAAVALYMADLTDWAEIYLVANDLKQADTRVGKYARRGVAYSPTLKGRFRAIRNTIKGKNNSMIESIPIDPEGEAGSNADMIQFSELWGAQDEAKSRMWTEMTLSPTKFGKSFRWVESYAGYTEESEILYSLWELGVQQGELLWPDKLYKVTSGEPAVLEAYKNEAARIFCLWNTKPRSPWQTPEYYASEEKILLPSEFARMHRNQWVSNTDTFVPIEWWDACKGELPTPLKNQGMIVSMDAAVSDDTFGLLMAGKHPLYYSEDEAVQEEYKDIAVIYYAKRWKPPKGGKIDFVGTPENPGPELELRRLIEEYNVLQCAYDPYQLHDMADRLRKEGLIWMYPFPQGGGQDSRLWADSAFRDRIRDRRIVHDGNPELREHMQNADAKVDTEDRKVRIVKRVEKLKIDLAVCASQGTYEVFRLNL